jgi:hypothetical protein
LVASAEVEQSGAVYRAAVALCVADPAVLRSKVAACAGTAGSCAAVAAWGRKYAVVGA